MYHEKDSRPMMWCTYIPCTILCSVKANGSNCLVTAVCLHGVFKMQTAVTVHKTQYYPVSVYVAVQINPCSLHVFQL